MVYRQRATTVQDKRTRCNIIKPGTRVFVTSSHNHTNYSLFTDSCFLSAGRGIRPSWYIAKTDIMIYCQNGHHDLLQKCNLDWWIIYDSLLCSTLTLLPRPSQHRVSTFHLHGKHTHHSFNFQAIHIRHRPSIWMAKILLLPDGIYSRGTTP